jgi:hypothetical protein
MTKAQADETTHDTTARADVADYIKSRMDHFYGLTGPYSALTSDVDLARAYARLLDGLAGTA